MSCAIPVVYNLSDDVSDLVGTIVLKDSIVEQMISCSLNKVEMKLVCAVHMDLISSKKTLLNISITNITIMDI